MGGGLRTGTEQTYPPCVDDSSGGVPLEAAFLPPGFAFLDSLILNM